MTLDDYTVMCTFTPKIILYAVAPPIYRDFKKAARTLIAMPHAPPQRGIRAWVERTVRLPIGRAPHFDNGVPLALAQIHPSCNPPYHHAIAGSAHLGG
eukprot:COSAG02_NODE_923_length_15877_cov_26.660920_2_plen_98_part_00